MTNQYIILMADIIGSGKKDQKILMADFKDIISSINNELSSLLLSPMTITLGDEFQSVLKNLSAATQIIFEIEEAIVHREKDFKLRYIVVEGAIETPINPVIAYEMLGPGLTKAREMLNTVKNEKHRFHIEIEDPALSSALNNSFIIFQSVVDSWNLHKNHGLVTNFLRYGDYKIVAEKAGKTRSQIWKRKKTLMIEEYFAIKSVIQHLGGTYCFHNG